MANTIAQFNMQFDAIEDRLQLRVLSTDDKEIRVWLTRRYVRLLLKTLGKQLSTDNNVKLQFWQQEYDSVTMDDIEDADMPQFEEAYMATEDTVLPLGQDPVLVSSIAFRNYDNGNFSLVLGQEHEGGVKMQISLSNALVENLLQMLLEAARVEEWNLKIKPLMEDSEKQNKGNAVLH